MRPYPFIFGSTDQYHFPISVQQTPGQFNVAFDGPAAQILLTEQVLCTAGNNSYSRVRGLGGDWRGWQLIRTNGTDALLSTSIFQSQEDAREFVGVVATRNQHGISFSPGQG